MLIYSPTEFFVLGKDLRLFRGRGGRDRNFVDTRKAASINTSKRRETKENQTQKGRLFLGKEKKITVGASNA